MRAVAAIALGLLALPFPSPAHAEYPLAISIRAGAGGGGGHRENDNSFGTSGYAAADFAWRYRAGHALVASVEAAGGPLSGQKQPASSFAHPDAVEHAAVTLNFQASSPPGSGVASYIQGGLGVGRVTTDGIPEYRTVSPDGYVGPPEAGRPELREWGLALAGEIGLRLVPRPGPVGLLLGLHAGHVAAAHSGSSIYAAFLGLTFHPL